MQFSCERRDAKIGRVAGEECQHGDGITARILQRHQSSTGEDGIIEMWREVQVSRHY
jgi:uncharacterized protein YbbK (DUF523 family)